MTEQMVWVRDLCACSLCNFNIMEPWPQCDDASNVMVMLMIIKYYLALVEGQNKTFLSSIFNEICYLLIYIDGL